MRRGEDDAGTGPLRVRAGSSVDDAVALLERHGEEARLIAGGHSLLPLMKLRFAAPEVLDRHQRRDGAAADPGRRRSAADRRDGPPCRPARLRGRGRALPDPARRGAGDRRPCGAQPRHDRRVAVPGRSRRGPFRRARCAPRRGRDQGSSGERVVPVRELCTGPYETVVGPAEILTEIRLPIRPGPAARTARWSGERATGRSPRPGAVVWLDGDTISEVGLGLAAVGAPHFVASGRRGRGPRAHRRRGDGRRGRRSRRGVRAARPTSAGRPTTSARSPASSPSGPCAPLSPAAADRRRESCR